MPRGDDLVRLPAAVVESYEWQKDGACVGQGSELFFHPWHDTPSSRAAREKKAKAICAGCVVKTRCLEWSLEVREPYGVWGGVGEDERRRMLKAKRL